jgi:D-isomer specific 2-hydroxyacid dehydrogenase, NAD binding domain
MALLIVNLDRQIGNASAWRDTFAEQLPDLEIRIWPEAGEFADIEYLAFMHPNFDVLPAFPNLKAMFSRSAGVEAFINHPRLPKVPLGKVEPAGGDPMMTEYVMPLTWETEGIFCARTFAMMPRGAMLVNVGRGKHVVAEDLIRALDSGQLSYAALDALWPEPLPPESPLWLHPKVTVMPHVARRPTVAQLVTEIAANIRSIKAGGRLLQEIDITLGY